MGAVDTTYTFTATDTITSSKMNNIIDQTTITGDAIFENTLEVVAGKLKVRAQGIRSTELAANAVTSTQIADGAVTSGKLAAGGPTWYGNYTYVTQALELGSDITAEDSSLIDFHSSVGIDYNSRIIRYPGVNATFDFVQTGTAAIVFRSPSAAVAFEGPNGITLTNGGSSNANFPVPAGTAPIYGARAWVNFSGIGTVGANMTIRAGGNVSSVNKTATGVYRVTFATAMPDANYAAIVGSDANSPHKIGGVVTQTSGYVDIAYSQINTSSARENPQWGKVSIFR